MASQGFTNVQKKQNPPQVLKDHHNYLPVIQTNCYRCLCVCTVCGTPRSGTFGLQLVSVPHCRFGCRPHGRFLHRLAPKSEVGGSKPAQSRALPRADLSWCSSHPSPTTASPWYFQSQDGVPRIIRFSKISFMWSYKTGENGVILCVDPTLTPSCLFLQLHPGANLFLSLPLSSALQPVALSRWLRQAGGAVESQHQALRLPSPTARWAKQNSASTSFLTQKTVYISLHFQGYHGKEKCQKVTFF